MSLPEEDHPTAFASLTSTAILTKKPPLGIREALRGGPRDSGASRANKPQALPPPYRWNTWNSDAGRNAKPPHRPDGPDQPARTKPVLAVRKVVHLAKAGGGKAPLQKTSRASVPGHHPSGAEYQGVSFRKGKPPGFSARSGEGLPLNHEQGPKRSPDLGFFWPVRRTHRLFNLEPGTPRLWQSDAHSGSGDLRNAISLFLFLPFPLLLFPP